MLHIHIKYYILQFVDGPAFELQQVMNLKKQLQQKEQALIEKEKKVHVVCVTQEQLSTQSLPF